METTKVKPASGSEVARGEDRKEKRIPAPLKDKGRTNYGVIE